MEHIENTASSSEKEKAQMYQDLVNAMPWTSLMRWVRRKKSLLGTDICTSQKSHQQMITNDRKSILPGRFKSPLDLLDLGTES